MKTLKQLRKIQEAGADDYVVDPDDDEEALEYQPRSDGEIEFVDLHSVEVSNHPAAPEDQHVAKTSHNKHKGVEHPGEPVVKQGTSGDVKFAKFREKITKTPLRKGDKRQGDFKAGSVKEEVELDEAKKVTKKQLRDLEDRNEHGLVALKLAQSFGTPAEVKKIQDINKRHDMKGHIEYKDQKERDAIASKYWKMAEEVEFIDEAEQVVTLPKGVGFYDTTKYPIGGKFDRVTDSNGLKVTVKRRFKLYKGTDTEGMTSDGKKVAFQMRLAKEEVEFIEEAVKAGTIKLENGKSVKVTKEDAVAFNAVLKELNPENRKRMESEMMKDEKSYKNMLTFAKRTV
jgi:hypothetical protein